MITLIIPIGNDRRFKLKLPPDVAHWLHEQLGDALGLPRDRQRRPVRLRRGRWTSLPRIIPDRSAAR